MKFSDIRAHLQFLKWLNYTVTLNSIKTLLQQYNPRMDTGMVFVLRCGCGQVGCMNCTGINLFSHIHMPDLHLHGELVAYVDGKKKVWKYHIKNKRTTKFPTVSMSQLLKDKNVANEYAGKLWLERKKEKKTKYEDAERAHHCVLQVEGSSLQLLPMLQCQDQQPIL